MKIQWLYYSLCTNGRRRTCYQISLLELLTVQPSNGNKLNYYWIAVSSFLHDIQFPHGHLIIITATCTFAILLVLYLSLRHHIPHLCIRCFSANTSSQPTMANQNSSSQTSEPECSSTATQNNTQQENIAFTTYVLPRATN